MEIFGFVVLGIVVVGVIAYLGYLHEKKKREAIARWADSSGWRFFPGKRGEPDLPFAPFGTGHSRYSKYHLTKAMADAVPGLEGADVDMFHYHYAVTTHSGKSSSTTHYTFVCGLVEPGLELGGVSIRSEGFFDKIGQAIGFDDIDFEDHEFSKKFVVKARDRKEAYDLIDQRMMRFLIPYRKWRIETAGDLLFIHRSGSPNAERFAELADFIEGFLAHLPRALVNAERQRRGLPPAIDAGSAARHHRPDEKE
jgi:hypothetical protein